MKIWKTKHGYRIIRVLSGRSNVFLLTGGDKKILVDTGPGFMWRLLDHRLKKLNIIQLDYLVLTHAHFDHAANSGKLKELYGAAVIVHRSEAENLNRGTNPLTAGTNLIYRLISKIQDSQVSRLMNYQPCNNDYVVDSEFDLNQFGYDAYILHTPGHTSGSISVIVDNEIAIVGDCMFGKFRNSVYPPVAVDTKEMIKSWGKLLDTNCSIFIPSHGSPNTRALVQRDYDKRIKDQEPDPITMKDITAC